MKTNWKAYFNSSKWAGGGSETVSGAGSTLTATEQFRPALQLLLSRLDIKTLLDAPCGDFNWMKHVDLTGINYVGVDVIEDVIAKNKELYGGQTKDFMVLDITTDPLPKADLMLCRDCTFHLPFAFIWNLFENFVRSGIPYILLTNHLNPENRDMKEPGGYQRRNFLRAPFFLPRPDPENWLNDLPVNTDSGKPKRYVCLWHSSQIEAALDSAKGDGRVAVSEPELLIKAHRPGCG